MPALQQHYATFFNESDMDTLVSAGINHIRVPIGFWALIPTTGDEPYVNAGQMNQVGNLMQCALSVIPSRSASDQAQMGLQAQHARPARRALDPSAHRTSLTRAQLHGMPGNQNGEQQSGHNTSSINFCACRIVMPCAMLIRCTDNSTNQARADATLKAALAFVQASPYSSVISGISACNEPRPFDSQTNLAALRGYYDVRRPGRYRARIEPFTALLRYAQRRRDPHDLSP